MIFSLNLNRALWNLVFDYDISVRGDTNPKVLVASLLNARPDEMGKVILWAGQVADRIPGFRPQKGRRTERNFSILASKVEGSLRLVVVSRIDHPVEVVALEVHI